MSIKSAIMEAIKVNRIWGFMFGSIRSSLSHS